MNTGDQQVDYKTHILIGVRRTGIMTVIADWPYVPPQSEVQSMMDCTREPCDLRTLHADVHHAG
jgi:hypothetical protein